MGTTVGRVADPTQSGPSLAGLGQGMGLRRAEPAPGSLRCPHRLPGTVPGPGLHAGRLGLRGA